MLYGGLNQVTVVIPSLLIVIGFAYAIHVVSSYYEVVRLSHGASQTLHGSQEEPAVASTSAAAISLAEVTLPVVYTGITTGIGFLSLSTSSLDAIKQFAYIAAFGIAITMIITLECCACDHQGIALNGRDVWPSRYRIECMDCTHIPCIICMHHAPPPGQSLIAQSCGRPASAASVESRRKGEPCHSALLPTRALPPLPRPL